MSAIHAGPAGYRISIVDEDPLRARREARELLTAIAEADPQAALDIPRPQATEDDLPIPKGGQVTDLIGLVFSGGSMVAAGVQVWLARVPQRTIVVTRPDGATLSISGKQARADDEQIERFLSGSSEAGHEDGPAAE
ncbi:effector-associated constant component EACC1 [Streptomyces sp. NPDC054849]